jgi:hypothetical protein
MHSGCLKNQAIGQVWLPTKRFFRSVSDILPLSRILYFCITMLSRCLPLLFFSALFLFACEKQDEGWEARLNGRWVEVAAQNAKSLPAGCEIVFDRSFMSICNEELGSELNSKSGVNSGNGQIWINYRLSGQRHIEYRYDYAFDGDYLWLLEDQTDGFNPVVGVNGAKKYTKK